MQQGIRRFLASIVLVICTAVSIGGAAAHELAGSIGDRSVKIAIATDYPPFTMINSQGKPAGFLVDYWRLWSEKSGVPVEFIASDWAGTLEALKEHRAELHAGMFWTASRAEWSVMTDPLYTVQTKVFARRSHKGPLAAGALAGRKVAVIRGAAQVEFLNNNVPSAVLVPFNNPASKVQALLNGDVDFIVGEALPIKFVLARDGLVGEVRESAEPIFVNALFGGLSREHAGMLNGINKGLASLRSEELAELEAAWIFDPADRQFGVGSRAPMYTARERKWIAENPVVRIGVDPSWPPFEYIDESGEYQGMASEYIALLEERTGLKFEVAKGLSWDQVVSAAKDKRIDALALAAPTEQRETYLRFTRPYLSYPMVVVMRSDAPFIGHLDELTSVPIAVARNYVSHELLAKHHPDLTLVPVATAHEALEQVSDGRVEAYVGNLASISNVIRERGLTNLKVAATTPYRFEMGLGVRRDWPLLNAILDKALIGITKSEQDAIHARWVSKLEFQHGVDREELSDWLVRGAIALAIVLGGIFLWNWRLQKEIQERRVVEAKLRALATTDPLTGIANRRHFYDLASRELARMRRAGHPLSLIMIDIDHFKQINDQFGHMAGDKALKELATACQPCLRNSDIFGRLGGEEFAVLLPDTALAAAEQVAERLRHAAAEIALDSEGDILRLTISLGVAQAMAPAESFDSLVGRADKSLYSAKSAGRNRVKSSPPCGAVPMADAVKPEARDNVQALPSRTTFS